MTRPPGGGEKRMPGFPFPAPAEHFFPEAGDGDGRRSTPDWQKHHRRFYRIAGITIAVESDLPIDDGTFDRKFDAFRVMGPGLDTVHLRHHFELPDLTGRRLGEELYRKPPWAIYRQNGFYIYLGIAPRADDPSLHCVATFNAAHTQARIYNNGAEAWGKGALRSLTLFPSDQILIARLLADRQGCYLHSAGAILNGAGMLFVGHSEAGKSTLTTMLQDQAEILCDDRTIVRRENDRWRVCGTWSHGDVPVVSASEAPLRAILFLEKARENRIEPLTDRCEITRRLLAFVVRPLLTADWWDKTLALVEQMAREAPCYVMRLDRSGEIIRELRKLIPP